jgi:endonuclease/exonuclease/phosphatase family metal-dependent hydrolase
MKKLNLIDKVVFFCNSIVAVLLLLSYLLPYVAPKNFALISVLSLAVPLLIVLNVLFFIYWLLKVKKQFFLSLFVLLIGYNYVLSLYKFSKSKKVEETSNISVMNYNVRIFNQYKWIEKEGVGLAIVDFIEEEFPDIISIQEYYKFEKSELSFYDYKFINPTKRGSTFGQAIFSKLPIVNTGSIGFPETLNNAIFADVVKGQDTIRIYNIHLESLRITKDVEDLNTDESERIFRSVGQTFKMQQSQTELFLKHKEACPYPMIITGDFNNTPYSYVYRKIKGELQDAFTEAGNGFGRTFKFKYFPVRIDYILADKDFTVNGFKTFDTELSDHYPISTTLKLHK